MPKIVITESSAPNAVAQFDGTQGVVIFYPYKDTLATETISVKIEEVAAGKTWDSSGLASIDSQDSFTWSGVKTDVKKQMVNDLASSYGYNVYVVEIGLNSWKSKTDEDIGSAIDKALSMLSDKNKYNIDYVLSDRFLDKCVTFCNNRTDCCVILDDAVATKPEEDIEWKTYFGEEETASIFGCESAEAMAYLVRHLVDGSEKYKYAQFTGGPMKYSVGSSTESFPGSYMWLMCKYISDGQNPPYTSIAGVNRGIVRGGEITIEISSSEMEDWCGDESELGGVVGLNPIVYMNGYGNCIMGNNTLMAIAESGKTVTNYLHVRLLLNYLKKQLRFICIGLMFETNDNVLFNDFRARVTRVLEQMKQNRILQFYNIERGETTQSNELKAVITIKPYGTVEKFNIEIIPQNAEVNEVL